MLCRPSVHHFQSSPETTGPIKAKFHMEPPLEGVMKVCINTPFTQLLQTRVCFTNAGINTYGAEIHKVRKHAIHAFPLFLFLILLFRIYVKEPF